MIRLPRNNPVTPVNLFQQHHPHQLMRKCHLRKAQGKVRPLHNVPGQSQRTSYDKHNMAYPIHSQPLNPACQLLAGQHLPLNGQGNDVSPIFNIRKDTLSFLFLNLPLNGLAGPVRRLFILYVWPKRLLLRVRFLSR